jgi:hypothetical protein
MLMKAFWSGFFCGSGLALSTTPLFFMKGPEGILLASIGSLMSMVGGVIMYKAKKG